jgi:ATP phosphoribosyltransferase
MSGGSIYLEERMEREKSFRASQADLFADHTLTAATLRKQRLARTIERIKLKALLFHQTQIELERKLQLVREYENKHGVSVNEREKLRIRYSLRIPQV